MRNTFKILSKIPFYKSFHAFGFPKLLPMNITLSVTFRCNSRCKTCNVWKKSVKELTLDEIEKILISLGEAPVWFTMSGGEPFIRSDFVDICKLTYDICSPKVINIPTNGILYNIIPEKVEKILRECPDTQIVVNLSLDDIGERHNEIRGVKNNFEYTMKTYNELRKIKAKNFTLGIHTVLSNFNVDRFPEIYNELIKLNPDSYITEIAEERVELDTIGAGITPSLEKYSKAIDFLCSTIKNNVGVALRSRGPQDRGRFIRPDRFKRIQNAFRLKYYDMVKKVLVANTQIIPCYAGISSAHIAANGDVWFCCIKAEPIGNLRDANYYFSKVWYSQKANNMRKYIKDKNCFCPMANVSYTNIMCNFKSLSNVAWRFIR